MTESAKVRMKVIESEREHFIVLRRIRSQRIRIKVKHTVTKSVIWLMKPSGNGNLK